MKTHHNTVILAVTVLVLLASTIAHADNIYVSCFSSGTIEKFDSSGNRSTFASGLNGPCGLAFDSSGYLYAASYNGGTIEKFDSSGNRSTFASGLDKPSGLAFDNSGNLYVTNHNNNYYGTIEKFDSSGNSSTFASGLLASGLGSSLSLAFDGSSYLYATNKGNDGIITKFDMSGNSSTLTSSLYRISGLAFDSSDNLYAADNTLGFGRLYKFDSSGHVSYLGDSGIYMETGLAFDSSGNLYVGTNGNDIIEKFDSSGNKTIFASGLSHPACIATQVPEPATLLLFGLGAAMVRLRSPLRQ
jgi:sugar lactone lactonase YvrE